MSIRGGNGFRAPTEKRALQYHPDALPVVPPFNPLDDIVLDYLAPLVHAHKPGRLDATKLRDLASALFHSWVSYQSMPCIEFLYMSNGCELKSRMRAWVCWIHNLFGKFPLEDVQSWTGFMKVFTVKASQRLWVTERVRQQCLAYCRKNPGSVGSNPLEVQVEVEEDNTEEWTGEEREGLVTDDLDVAKATEDDYAELMGNMDEGEAEDMVDDPEVLLFRIDEARMEYEGKARKADKRKEMAMVPKFNHTFHPSMPAPITHNANSHDDILNQLVIRLVRLAHAQGEGVKLSLGEIQTHVEIFINLYLRPLSFQQLQNIEKSPRVIITLDHMQQCGFSTRPSSEQAFTYFKIIKVPTQTVLAFRRTHSKDRTKMLADDAANLLKSLKDEGCEDGSDFSAPDSLPLCHVGRLTHGLAERRRCELTELRRSQEEGRTWIEAVKAGRAVNRETEYLLMADHSHLTGQAWRERVLWDELLFALLFINPLNTNSAWPGGLVPSAPTSVRLSHFEELAVRSASPANVLDDSLLALAIENRQVYGRTSWDSLKLTGFKSVRQHPQQFIKLLKRSKPARMTAVCPGIDIPFALPYSYNKSIDAFIIRTKIFVVKTSPRHGVIARPAGVYFWKDSTKGPLSAVFSRSVDSKISPVFQSASKTPSTITARLKLLPGSNPAHRQICLHLTTDSDSGWLLDQGGFIEPLNLQQEAVELLFDGTTSPCNLHELRILPGMESSRSHDLLTGFRRVKRGKTPPSAEVRGKWTQLQDDVSSCQDALVSPVAAGEEEGVVFQARAMAYTKALEAQREFIDYEHARWDLSKLGDISQLMEMLDLGHRT